MAQVGLDLVFIRFKGIFLNLMFILRGWGRNIASTLSV